MSLQDEIKSQKLKLNDFEYENLVPIKKGACAEHIFSAKKTDDGQYVVIKIYPKGLDAKAFSRGKVNHFGRARDVSLTVFEEVKGKNTQYPFLIKFIDRGKKEGQWILIIEKAEGELLPDYIHQNIRDIEILKTAGKHLGKHLRRWHNSNFAHGDAHLNNVIYDKNTKEIKLIDLNMLHHPDFKYCKKMACSFDRNSPQNRFVEDLENVSDMGTGFVRDLKNIEQKYNMNGVLVGAFNAGYV